MMKYLFCLSILLVSVVSYGATQIDPPPLETAVSYGATQIDPPPMED